VHGDPLKVLPNKPRGPKREGICTIEGCGLPVKQATLGLCGGHYQRWQKDGNVRANRPVQRRDGRSNAADYTRWKAMWSRCTNPNSQDYPDYGGRGIRVCDEWRDFRAYEAHVAALPHYGELGRSIDRIDNEGDYEPGNIRWATALEQVHNRRPQERHVA
jgi:hypothetical protein